MPLNLRSFNLVCIIGLIIYFMLASACSTMHRDGPPRRYVDVSRIPDAVPKVEPLSRYGNLPKYRVHGKIYHVKSSSHNYQERGIASWYGTKFDAQQTSSGEIYNMLSMTAAHKTLPLPTYARVTNLHNHKSIIVKINDRGPFAPGRIIDLSYAAAKKLDMTARGTAYVEVKAIDPKQYVSNQQRNSSPIAPIFTAQEALHRHPTQSERFFLQIGTFQNRQFAERLKNRALRLVSTPVRITFPSGHKVFYRVEVGPVKSSFAAIQIRQQLKTAGITQSNIIRRQHSEA